KETLLGIGKVADNRIDAIVSVMKGAGGNVLAALAGVIEGERVLVEVATTNEPAMRLYSSMGFMITSKISDWYRVL
ncbi:MAG: hypothetical protein IKU07_08575, partial [Oscillospiraceae bacterium]|nr:hypothetical protein [Oscillospiraceae bacterium]